MANPAEGVAAACTVALACCALPGSGVAETLPGQETAAAVIAFMDVAYVSPGGDSIDHQAVVVSGDRIVWVGPSAEASLSSGATIIDGAGLHLVAGLIDAHVHMTEADLPLFLANGVTTIRELNGTAEHLRLRDRIAAGEVLGPDLIVFSPLLAGEPQRWRHLLLVDPEATIERVLELAESGYDGLKVYDGLSAEVYEVIVGVAGDMELPVTGHIPAAVGLEDVLATGQGLEHLETIVVNTVGRFPDDAAFERIDGIVRRIVDAGVSVTPTLAVQRALGQAGTPAYAVHLERAEMRFVDADTLAWWRSLGAADGRAGSRRVVPSPFYTFQSKLVLALDQADVPLLLGTDTPNPLMVPGYSVHEEFAALSEAGLTAQAILRTATTTPARELGYEGERGVIAVGARADLVLVRDNPFANLATLADPLGTMVGGRWLDRSALDALLMEVGQGR